MLLIRRLPEKYEASFVSPVGIYSSPTGRDPNFNQIIAQGYRDMMQGKQPRVTSLRRDSHDPGPACWLHGESFCLSTGE